MAADSTPTLADPSPPATTEPIAPLATEPPPRPRLWPSAGWRIHMAVVMTLGLAVLIVYSGSFLAEFAHDSRALVLDDVRIRSVSGENIRTIWRTDARPLTTLSFLINYAVLGNGTNPPGYHLVNCLVHWANVTLAYFILLALTGNIWPAFLAGAIFALHPLASEAVINVGARAELLGAWGVLGGVLCYARSHVEAGARKAPWLLAVAGAALAGMFAHVGAVALVGWMAVLDATRPRPERPDPQQRSVFWDWMAGYLVWAVAALVWWGTRAAVTAEPIPREIQALDNPLVMADTWTAKLTALGVLWKYFQLLLWPMALSPDYSFNQIPLATWRFTSWEAIQPLLGLVAACWLALVAVRFWRRNRPLVFGILAMMVALLPVSGLLATQPRIMADRYAYLAVAGYAGLAVFAVYGCCRLVIARVPTLHMTPSILLQATARTVLVALTVWLAFHTWGRNEVWQSDLSLWRDAVRSAPRSYKVHRSLAYALYEAGQRDGDENRDLDEIIEHAETAFEITDQDLPTLVHLGHYYALKGNSVLQRTPDKTVVLSQPLKHWYGKALAVLNRAAELDRAANQRHRAHQVQLGQDPAGVPDVGNYKIYWNSGVINARLGNYNDALAAYTYMRQLAPANADAYLGLATVYLGMRQFEQAAIPLLQARVLDESRSEALTQLVEVYRQIDREGCSIEFSHAQPQLNLNCAMVRDHICRAYAGLVQALQAAQQSALAQKYQAQALKAADCTSGEQPPPVIR